MRLNISKYDFNNGDQSSQKYPSRESKYDFNNGDQLSYPFRGSKYDFNNGDQSSQKYPFRGIEQELVETTEETNDVETVSLEQAKYVAKIEKRNGILIGIALTVSVGVLYTFVVK